MSSIEEGKAGRNGEKWKRSSSSGILFSQTSRPELGGRQAEQGKNFHPNNLIWQNMLEIFINIGYTDFVVNCGLLKIHQHRRLTRAQSHHGSEEERKKRKILARKVSLMSLNSLCEFLTTCEESS